MIIGGFQKFSLIDYPGKISSIIFTQGCNFACSYCHNKELIRPKEHNNIITPEEIISFLKQRRKKIDAVVITGGEPTLQPDLTSFMEKVKKLGFFVKLDTNGSMPKVIKDVINNGLADYIAMDLKAPLEKYSSIVQREINTENISQSLTLIKNSTIRHEFRTTVLKSLLSEKDINKIRTVTSPSRLVLQKYIPSKGLERQLGQQKNYTDAEFEGFRQIFTKQELLQGSECLIR